MRLIDAGALETHEIYEGEWVRVVYADDIDNAPTVEAEPVRHGRWVWKNKKVFCPGDCWWPPTEFKDTWKEKEGSWIEKELYCSECNYENYRHYKSNFCPNCGAKMEVDDA